LEETLTNVKTFNQSG